MFIDGAESGGELPSLERLKTQAIYIAGKETVKNNVDDRSRRRSNLKAGSCESDYLKSEYGP